jgi:hypothetical protein
MMKLDTKRYTTPDVANRMGKLDREAKKGVRTSEDVNIGIVDYGAIAKANLSEIGEVVRGGATVSLFQMMTSEKAKDPQAAGMRGLMIVGSPVFVPMAVAIDVGSILKDGADAAVAGVKAGAFALKNAVEDLITI